MSRKINQLIKLEDLANTYAQIIGNYMDIKLNVATDVDPYRSQAIMFATRQPYKISNIKAEQLQIALRFYVCCETETEYNEAIKILTQLLGYNKGIFTSNEKQFKYFSFLDLQRPLGDPEVNSGKFFQTLELVGQCLVTQCKGGAFVANEIKTMLYLDPATITTEAGEEVTNYATQGEIEVLSSVTTLAKNQESPQMSNDVVGKAINTTQSYSYTMTILILKDAIGERLIKALENIQPIGLNEAIKLEKQYPAFTGDKFKVEKTVVMTGGVLKEDAGTFVTAEISLQDKLEIPETIKEESYTATVIVNASNIEVASISGDYIDNNDGTYSCKLGCTVAITMTGTNYRLNINGGTYVKTSSSFVVSPQSFNVTVTSAECTISSYYSNPDDGTITI